MVEVLKHTNLLKVRVFSQGLYHYSTGFNILQGGIFSISCCRCHYTFRLNKQVCQINKIILKFFFFLIKPIGYKDPFEAYCRNEGTSKGWTVGFQKLFFSESCQNVRYLYA